MDLNAVLLLAFICMAMGFFACRLVSSLGRESAHDTPDRQGEDVLKVWRDSSNTLVVEIDAGVYKHGCDLSPKQRHQLHRVMVQLSNWMEPAMTMLPELEDTTTSAATSSKMDGLQEAKPRLRFNPIDAFADSLRADVPKSALPTESIVGQIDDILQRKLKASGLRDKAVRLMEWPDKGMVVMIGLDRYEGVDDVPDEEIRDLIRSAVKEWEQG